jgi:S-adenosylmethionine decarboxylase
MKMGGQDIVIDADAEKYFFEGTEKLLEVWFECTSGDDRADLRLIDRSDWETLLSYVQCTIISQKCNSSMTAYVLSESSMFITKNRFILKTCGKTTLLAAVKPLLELVHQKCGFDVILDVFYSHKNYMRPEQQHEIHRHFDDEVAVLETIFDDGAAYALGKINSDCWYLFTIDMVGVSQPDQTLELIMVEVDQDVMNMFTQDYGLTASELTRKTGILDLIQGTIIDDFLFNPCGYSMNGILPNGCYFTIHITPEPEFSYVSFESNVPQESYEELIGAVLDIFKPGKFQMTLFANEASCAADAHHTVRGMTWCKDYRRSDYQFCQIKNYSLVYSLFTLQPPVNG